jgi:lipopolysaccharide/colanic/teichoic acid biosynthesis glycosyltransferase
MYATAKRGFDIAFSMLGLVLLSPLLCLSALAVWLYDRGPVFFRQERVGRGGRPFFILKFRSMVVDAERLGLSLTKAGDCRITPIGRILRMTKLDELPQLWNVLMGEMSFVGPRPEVPRYVAHYTPEQRQVLNYTPGITDLATVSYRNEEAMLRDAGDAEKFYLEHCMGQKTKLNLAYARRASLLSDVWIILQTLCPYWLGVLLLYTFVLSAAYVAAYLLRFEFEIPSSERQTFDVFFMPAVGINLLFLLGYRELLGMVSYVTLLEVRRCATALGLAAVVQLLLWLWAGGRMIPPRSVIILNALLALVLLTAGRVILRRARERLTHGLSGPATSDRPKRVAIVGALGRGASIGSWLARGGDNNRRLVAFFDDNPDLRGRLLHAVPIVGLPELIERDSWSSRLDEVIVVLPETAGPRTAVVCQMLDRIGLEYQVVSPFGFLDTAQAASSPPSLIPPSTAGVARSAES